MHKSPDSIKDSTTSPTEMSHGAHITVGTLQGFAASSLSLPTGLLTAAFLSRLLGPEGYGHLSVAASIVVWIEASISMGFSRAAVKLVAEAEDWRSVSTRFLQAQLMVALGAALLLASVAPVLAGWLDAPEFSAYLRLFSLGIPFSALYSIHQSILVGRGFFGRRAFMVAAYWLSRMVLILLFVGLWPSVSGAVTALVGTTVLMFIGIRFWVNPALFGHSDLSFRNLWDFTWPLFFYSIGISLFNRLDLLFVKGLSGIPEAAGFYGATKNLTIVPTMFAMSLSPLLLSKLTQIVREKEKEAARNMAQRAIRLVFCMLPFAGMAAGAATEVVTAIYGFPFLPAGQLLSILIFAAIGICVITVSASTLIAVNRPEVTFYLTAPLVVLALGALYIVVPRFGPTGAAVTTTGLTWAGAVAILVAVKRVWRVRPSISTLVRNILICGLAYAGAVLWPTPGLLLCIKLPVISCAIVVALISLGEFSEDEIAFARSIIQFRTAK